MLVSRRPAEHEGGNMLRVALASMSKWRGPTRQFINVLEAKLEIKEAYDREQPEG